MQQHFCCCIIFDKRRSKYGEKARQLCRLKLNKLKSVTAPVIAKDKNDEFFIIAKSKEDKFMVLFSDKTQPEIKSREELAEIWDGTALLITKKGIMDREAIFSFKWFIPTILKFKKEFIQVLIAVFTIQILGILTPVMTQVVGIRCLYTKVCQLSMCWRSVSKLFTYMN